MQTRNENNGCPECGSETMCNCTGVSKMDKCWKCGKETDTLKEVHASMADEEDNPYDITDCMRGLTPEEKEQHPDFDGEYLDEDKFIAKYSKDDLEQFWFIDQLINTYERQLWCDECRKGKHHD